MVRPVGSKNRKNMRERYALSAICKEYSESAIRVLIDIMQDTGAKHSDRITASIAILDRAYGRPVSTVELTDPDGAPIAPTISFYLPDNGRGTNLPVESGKDETK